MTGLPTPEERPWLTVAELAQITGEGEKAIRAAISAGTLPSLRVGRYVRIPTAKLRQMLGIDEAARPQTVDNSQRGGSVQRIKDPYRSSPVAANGDEMTDMLHSHRGEANRDMLGDD